MYQCYSCNYQFDYPSSVSDPDSSDFDKACCPNCESTSIAKQDPSYEYEDTTETEKFDFD